MVVRSCAKDHTDKLSKTKPTRLFLVAASLTERLRHWHRQALRPPTFTASRPSGELLIAGAGLILSHQAKWGLEPTAEEEQV